MGKQFNERPQGAFNQRGRGAPRGGPGMRGGPNIRGGPRGNFDQGPPSYVIPYATFLHKSENNLVLKCTDMSRFPKFNRGVYLENKAKIGLVDEILGPINSFYFSVKPVEGVDAKSFKEGQVFYMNPEDLLTTDRFTKPAQPRPKGPRGPPGQGRFGGRPQQGGPQRGNFNNRGGPQGNRGGFGNNRRPNQSFNR